MSRMIETLEARNLFSVGLATSDAQAVMPVGAPVVTVPVPALPTHGVKLRLVAGQRFTGVVGQFGYGQYVAPIMALGAGIAWGDGTSSEGRVMALGQGRFAVVGSHAYAKPGHYDIDITVTLGPNPAVTPRPMFPTMLLGTIHSAAEVR